jgi:hypothetical protein
VQDCRCSRRTSGQDERRIGRAQRPTTTFLRTPTLRRYGVTCMYCACQQSSSRLYMTTGRCSLIIIICLHQFLSLLLPSAHCIARDNVRLAAYVLRPPSRFWISDRSSRTMHFSTPTCMYYVLSLSLSLSVLFVCVCSGRALLPANT